MSEKLRPVSSESCTLHAAAGGARAAFTVAAAAEVPVRGDAGDSRPAAAGANNAGSGGVERTLVEDMVTEAPLRTVEACALGVEEKRSTFLVRRTLYRICTAT